VISTAEPRQQVYATCTTGTTCNATRREPIRDDQEVSWKLELVTTQGEKVVTGFKVCLVGRA
jgi:hypothetical protein